MGEFPAPVEFGSKCLTVADGANDQWFVCYQADRSIDGKKVLLVGTAAPLAASLQCLLQRKGAMVMSCQWKTQQLQSKVTILFPNIKTQFLQFRKGTKPHFEGSGSFITVMF